MAILLLSACGQSPVATEPGDRLAHIQDQQAKAILMAAIEEAGGLERWESLKSLRFSKDFRLLLESGAVEQEYRQLHEYQFDPLEVEITSNENGKVVQTVLKDGKYARKIDGTPAEVSAEALESAVNSATYVVSMPFKLAEPGPDIRYLGVDTLAEGRPADVIEVTYNPGSDVWRYYFSRPDGRIVANWVKTSDHYSLVENLSYERAGGILFNKERKSYRVDSLGNKLYLRADYSYANFRVE